MQALEQETNTDTAGLPLQGIAARAPTVLTAKLAPVHQLSIPSVVRCPSASLVVALDGALPSLRSLTDELTSCGLSVSFATTAAPAATVAVSAAACSYYWRQLLREWLLARQNCWRQLPV